MLVARRVVVGDAGLAGVDVGAAELLRGHVLTGRRLHERRAADEDRPGAGHDHGLVAHRRHVGAAGGARAHHDRDLRDPGRRHAGLVEEDAPEVLAVREHVRLQRQEGAARIDEVETGQPVLLGDLLRAEVLLHRQREVRAALDRRVVGHDHALLTLDHADAGDDPGARGLSLVHVPGGQRVQLEERRAGIDQPVDPLAGEQLAARAVALDRALAAASGDLGGTRLQLVDELFHPSLPAREVVGSLDTALQQRHGRSLDDRQVRALCPSWRKTAWSCWPSR